VLERGAIELAIAQDHHLRSPHKGRFAENQMK
jgi:hypothetical protein